MMSLSFTFLHNGKKVLGQVFSGHCSMIVSRSREEAVQPAEDTGCEED